MDFMKKQLYSVHDCKSEGETKNNDSQMAKISNASNGSKYYRCPHN